MKEAQTCFDGFPGDADGQIVLVTELQDHGRRAEADALYTRALTLYTSLQRAYPDSAPANNLVAWFEGRCHRDLDQALTLSQKAVDLEPASAGIIDTLAEVHYQRGQFDRAIELTRRCIDLEPAVSHYRENLDRFIEAKKQAADSPKSETRNPTTGPWH
jgi:tetratricopeptide (TPR) repeat protein